MPEVFEFAELRIMYDHAMKLHPEVANFALQKLTQESMERAKTFYKSMLLQSGVGADSLALQKAKLHAHILLYLQGDKEKLGQQLMPMKIWHIISWRKL